MGGKEVTQIIIETAPPVLDLLSKLLSWIEILALAEGGGQHKKKLTRKSPTESHSFQELDQDCISRATGHFLQDHSYPFSGEDSSPPHNTRDFVHSNEDFFNAQQNNLQVISGAVRSAVKDTTADWAMTGVIQDITSRLTVIVQGPPTNAWRAQSFSLTFPDSTGAKTYQVDLTWVYCTTLAADQHNASETVNTLFLYSIGVGYETESWKKRLEVVPPAIPVVRIAFAYTTIVMGTAIAAFIYTAKDKPSDIIVTVDAKNMQGNITISTKDKVKLDEETGSPIIPYQWALNALLEAGITKTSVQFGPATGTETTEIQYLKEWEAGEP